MARRIGLLLFSVFITSAVWADTIYISDAGADVVYQYTSQGTRTTFATGFTFPLGIALDAQGNVYVADGSSNGAIYRISSSGGKTTFASGLDEPFGLAFGPNGVLYEADDEGSDALDFNSTGVEARFAGDLAFPQGIAVDAFGNIYISALGSPTTSASGLIYKYSPSGGRTVFASGLDHPGGLAFNANGDLFEADFGNGINTGDIYEFTPLGVRSTFASGLRSPVDVAFDSQGNLFVTDSNSGNIFEFAPNGAKSIFATETEPTFLAISQTSGLPTTVPEPRYLVPLAGCASIFIFARRRKQV